MKRHLFRIIILVTFIGLVYGGPTVRAATDPSFFKIDYDEINMTCTIIGYNVGLPANVDIPDIINGYRVTSIGDIAFRTCRSLTSITIPTGVTSIGFQAFSECESLTSITIPTGVTSIGVCAFWNCVSLTSITIPTGVTSIGDDAFSLCRSLKSITIPTSLTSIGNKVFSSCVSLSSITIPTGVTSIGVQAFYLCTSLSSITIPTSVTSIGNYAFSYCTSLSSITIPTGVTSIGDGAFYGCEPLKAAYFKGNAPNMGTDIFTNCAADEFTVYYRSSSGGGYTGWSYPKVALDDMAPVLSNVTPTALKTGNVISAISNKTGALYLVPKGNYASKADLDKEITVNRGKSVTATANIAANIETSGLTDVIYQLYAVDNVDSSLDIHRQALGLGPAPNLSNASADIIISDVPVIIFIRPWDGATLNINTGSTVIAKIYDIGTGIDINSVTIQIDNGVGVKPTALVQTGDGYTLYHVITNINYGTPDNSHTITVTACDSTGGTGSASVNFIMKPKRKGFGFGRLRFE